MYFKADKFYILFGMLNNFLCLKRISIKLNLTVLTFVFQLTLSLPTPGIVKFALNTF